MKTNYLIKGLFALSFIAFVIMGCEEEDAGEIIANPLTESAKVYLSPENRTIVAEAANATVSADGQVINSSNTIEISVIRTGSDFSAQVTVGYTAVVTYKNTTDFFNAGDDASSTVNFSSEGSIVIPAGETAGSLTAAITDDVFATGDRNINIALTSTDVGELGLSTTSPNTSIDITIQDDDCPIDIATFEGTYTMAAVGSTGAFNDGFDLCASASRDCSGNVTLTAIASDPTGTTATIDHPSFGNPLEIKFVTCSSEVTVENSMDTWFGNSWFVRQGNEIIGTYDDEKKSMVVVVDVANFDEFDIILTKNP